MLTAGKMDLKGEFENRRQEALAVAEQCVAVLMGRFGAHRVIPFGSVVGKGPWHAGSDLDLAVEGLPSGGLRDAERYLEGMAPPWLEVDLVPLEQVYPEVRARILGGDLMPESPFLALKVRLEDELVGLERIVQGLRTALERAGEAPDEFATRALASYVEDFYSGCERICERVAVALDSGYPEGEGWHRALLKQMGVAGGKDRPPLWSASLLLELDDYRRFRHRVRHLYGYELATQSVLTLAQGVKLTFGKVREEVGVFGNWLGQRKHS